MKIKSYKEFMLEEGTTLSPRSQYVVDLALRADGEVILLRTKGRKYKILKLPDVLVIKK